MEGQHGRAAVFSRSEYANVAVGFNPRNTRRAIPSRSDVRVPQLRGPNNPQGASDGRRLGKSKTCLESPLGLVCRRIGFERRDATGSLGRGIPALKRPAYIQCDATRLQPPNRSPNGEPAAMRIWLPASGPLPFRADSTVVPTASLRLRMTPFSLRGDKILWPYFPTRLRC
jgi:hypothetical protein